MLRTTIFKIVYLSMTALLVLAFAIGAAGAQPAQAAPSTQVSDGWMPLTGSLYDAQTDSIASFNGLVHILARWTSLSSGGAQIDIDANLPAASVTVTTDTGIPYSAFGPAQSSIFLPPSPIFPTDPYRLGVPAFLMVTVGSDPPPSQVSSPLPTSLSIQASRCIAVRRGKN